MRIYLVSFADNFDYFYKYFVSLQRICYFTKVMEKGTRGELNHVLPRWLIEAAFVVMVLSAICSWHDIQVWISANCPVLLAVVQNAGMLVMYYAIMMAMRPLNHSLTWLWCCVIALGVAGFVTVTLGPAFALYNFYVATLHSLAYLPLGTLLMVWHPGRLRVVGGWMISAPCPDKLTSKYNNE